MAETIHSLVISRWIKQGATESSISAVSRYLSQIESIIRTLPKNDRDAAKQILLEISNTTLKEFLANYDCNSASRVISILYQAILTQHKVFYESLISYKHDTSNITMRKPFECQVWNQSYLIPLIFQFLDLTSLINCSLVNIKWFRFNFNIFVWCWY